MSLTPAEYALVASLTEAAKIHAEQLAEKIQELRKFGAKAEIEHDRGKLELRITLDLLHEEPTTVVPSKNVFMEGL